MFIIIVCCNHVDFLRIELNFTSLILGHFVVPPLFFSLFHAVNKFVRKSLRFHRCHVGWNLASYVTGCVSWTQLVVVRTVFWRCYESHYSDKYLFQHLLKKIPGYWKIHFIHVWIPAFAIFSVIVCPLIPSEILSCIEGKRCICSFWISCYLLQVALH